MSAKKLFVIGAGPAGYPAALRARELGAEVVLAEKREIGGVCLNWGCVPSKSFLDSAHLFDSLELIKQLSSGEFAAKPDWGKIQERRQSIVSKLKTGLEKLLVSKGVKILRGEAAFISAGEAEIRSSGRTTREKFDSAIIAAGTEAFFPPPFDSSPELTLDNVSVFSLAKLPESVILVGGGAVGVELACFFHALGTKTSIVEMTPSLLPGEDSAVRRSLETSFQKRGINIHMGVSAQKISSENGLKRLTLSDGNEISAEEIVVCAGRVTKLEGLGLEKIGVSWNRKGIRVDETLRTEIPNVFAAGDVNGLSLLAHAATRQGEIAAENALGGSLKYENSLIPRCVYTWPEIACVGVSSGGAGTVSKRAFFAASARALAQGRTEGFVQTVIEEGSGKIIGAQIVGQCASEMIHVFSLAIKSGMTAKDLAQVVFAHPTLSETIREAILR